MPRPLDPDIHEASLIKHNIAQATAIVAAVRGIKPKPGGPDPDMNVIMHEVKDAYKYTIWHIERHQGGICDEIVSSFGSGVWN